MPTTLLNLIRIANREFRDFFEEVSRVATGVERPSVAFVRIQQVARRLEQVGKLLERPLRLADWTGFAGREIAEYQENLRRLRNALETIQYALLAERSHLQNVWANLQAASAWAATLKQTS
jgi:HPt (histidine-containing phosphotransfer) domain-containing protein